MSESPAQRRLAAILAADVVGYSRMMEADEAGTFAALKHRRKSALEPLVAQYKGRVFKISGDAVMVEFASAVSALQCAIELQKNFAITNADLPEDRRIVLRIGVHVGDVMVEGTDLYGDGVNIAARLEALAEPGGVLISEDARRQVGANLALGFDEVGPQSLKNIDRQIGAFRVVAAVPLGAKAKPAQSEKPSIAVLPFTNMSGDPGQEFLADGITEDLITQLSRFRQLFVISRNSTFVFKNKPVNLSEIADKLKVRYVAEGSVRKAGSRVRVTVQLIDAKSDTHIWAENYDRQLEDIFELQDEVVRTVAATLVGRLEHAALENVKNRPQGDLRAYELYLRGGKHFVIWTPEDNRQAIQLFRGAIEVQPDYAAAHASFAEALFRDWLNGWSDDPSRDFAASHESAKRSVQLDDEDSRTHAALGLVLLYHGERERARFHLERSMQLNPSNAHALACLSRLELLAGNPEAASEHARQAAQLNPFGKYGWYFGQAHYVARRYDDATKALKSLSDPAAVVRAWLAASHAMAGREQEAKATRDAFVMAASSDRSLRDLANPDQWRQFFSERWPFWNEADFLHLLDGLRRAGLPL